MCVLVVEDDQTLGILYLKNLEILGQQAGLARSASEAVKLIEDKKNEFGLVLMDIGLPDKDGLELTQEIRTSGGDMPIVAVTAGHANRDSCLQAGMDDYYVKPILLETLNSILQRWNLKRCKTPCHG